MHLVDLIGSDDVQTPRIDNSTPNRHPAAENGAPDLDIGGCSTELIEGAWRITGLLLSRADTAGKQRLVRIRQAYLDELNRRDPIKLQSWAIRALADPDAPLA